MKKPLLFLVLLAFTTIVSNAQYDDLLAEMPETIALESGDVDKLLRTWEPMKKDFEALGDVFEQESQDYSKIKEIYAKPEVKRIFNKHGWNGEEWLGKFTTIWSAYGILTMEKEMMKMSEEEKKQLAQFQGNYMDQLKSRIRDSDLAEVKKRYNEIEKAFVEDEDNEGY